MSRVARLCMVALAVLAAGCSAAGEPSDSATTAAGEPGATSSSTTTVAPLPEPPDYIPATGEPSPEIKQTAAAVVQALLTYPAGAGDVEAARQRLSGLPAAPDVADGVVPLLRPRSASSAEIVYPQFGGLLEDSSSVMVVTRLRSRGPEGDTTVVRTLDVRLERRTEGWVVTDLASLGGQRPPTSAASAVGAAVLANPRIDLPTSARWDILAGRVDDRVLQTLTTMSETHDLAVTTFSTGHPIEVFGTSSVSNHTEGRGVDIWGVDNRPVIAQRDDESPLRRLVADTLALGVTELGSPWALGGGSFTNTLHQDHLHVAFDQ